MSFEANNMNTIHLGNYEEFFILYMDNELSQDQVKMVNEFLLAHPDLKAEFEILMSTRLPLEEFRFDKNDLLADSMKQTLVDEELLLYIDNELPVDKKRTVEAEIVSDNDYQLQHQLLLQTKLNPSEIISYPNKKELYRRTEKVASFKGWMRVAAAVIVIVVAGLFYFKNSPHPTSTDNSQNNIAVEKNPVQQNEKKKDVPSNSVSPSSKNLSNDQVAIVKSFEKKKESIQNIVQKKVVEENQMTQDVIALNNGQQQEKEIPQRPKVTNVQFDGTNKTIALVEPKVSVNNPDVTSSSIERNINETATVPEGTIASNSHKGSIKGFLRKATRVIEKRTGIDPTNQNGELLIGAVAINLK